MSRRRPGLFSAIAGALGIMTLAVLVLSAGVFWVVLEQAEVQRRTDLALSLGGVLQTQLEVALRNDGDLADVVAAYGDTSLDLHTLYLVDRDMKPIRVVAGTPPSTPDVGMRAALHGRGTHTEVAGSLMAERRVVVSAPVGLAGQPRAVLRVAVVLRGPEVPGGGLGFALLFVVLTGGGIALFGWARLRREVVQPILRIRQGTESIAAGDFGAQLSDEALGEIQDLVAALNAMSASLASYQVQMAEQVAELEAANLELRQAQEALIRSEKLAGVGRMAAGLAHEVGNPLSAVCGYVDLLQAGGSSEEDTADMLVRARAELDRIHRVIQSLLGYARVGTEGRVAVDWAAQLEAAVDTVRHQTLFQDMRFAVEVEPLEAIVQMEEDKLHQVVVNLLLNAAAASPGGAVWLRVRPVSGDWVELRCVDDGPGFDAVALERAFEPFFTTKEVGEGTGLGLATCEQVITGLGGSIEAFNLTEGGACVQIRLPSSSA